MKLRAALLAAPLLCLSAFTAGAHEFLVKPDAAAIAEGQPLGVSLYITEIYIKPDRLPPAGSSELVLVTATGATPVALTEDKAGKRLHANVTAPAGGFVLAAQTGRTRAASERNPKSTRMESFSKALVNVGENGIHGTALGTKLEIVPVSSPAGLKAGDTLTVKVLFDGKPVAGRVQATYDGHTDKEHGYVVRTESGADGIARIGVTAPGLWLIRTKAVRDGGVKDADVYEASASLLFRVE